CAGADVESSRMAIKLANKYDCVWATVGMHPESGIMNNESCEELRRLLKQPKVVAVGECGLETGSDEETELFKFNIDLAKETGFPLVVHCRDMFEKVFEVLNYDKVQMHCFTGNEEEMRECVRRGWYISFGGILTFKKSNELRRVAGLVPEDKILVETDSPYLAPEPVRGTKNVPTNVKYVLDCLAKSNMEQITSENARRLFGI
ncbi:MAG: Mg-dependent DNase, partial [Microgenomates group bacterium Gr01-1014_16]